jgi:hypothetical protein
MRRTLGYKLTPEDRATRSKWVRFVAAFYGCAALLLMLMAITLPGPSQSRGSAVLAHSPHRSNPPDAAGRSDAGRSSREFRQ